MNKKAVSLILLSTLSGSITTACSDNADVKTQTPQSELTTEPKPELKIAATDSKQGSIIQTDSNAEDKAVVMSSDENVLGIKQAETFQAIYASTCMQYLLKLDELRGNLKALPKFPTAQASQILAGETGSAWPVPADTGSYILAIPDNKNLCAIYAKELDAQLANQQFTEVYSKPPSPFIATQIDNTTKPVGGGVKTTLSYSWSAPDTQRKMLFMLTIDDSATTDVKAMYTASIMSE